jgi:rubrerythrin
MDTLTVEEVRALQEALDDEYHAWASYDQVISDFGPVRPFVHIRDAEARHALALSDLFVRYGQPLPANTWRGRVARHASLQAACEAAVAAEVANAEMYERLLASTQRPDIQAVLRKLQQASQQRHLPAFQRCAQRGGGGRGAGRRHQGRGAPP